MAKATANNLSSKIREQLIRNCKKCNGNPPLGTCELQGIVVTYCDRADCMEVINYNSSGMRKIKQQKIVANIEQEIKENVDNRVNSDRFHLRFRA
jgi:hypothetical protein